MSHCTIIDTSPAFGIIVNDMKLEDKFKKNNEEKIKNTDHDIDFRWTMATSSYNNLRNYTINQILNMKLIPDTFYIDPLGSNNKEDIIDQYTLIKYILNECDFSNTKPFDYLF